jgi:hypothetical protein
LKILRQSLPRIADVRFLALIAGTALASGTISSGPAFGQSFDPRVDALERQIQAMEAAHEREMRALKDEVRALTRALAVREQQRAAPRNGTGSAVARSGDKQGPAAPPASNATAPSAASSPVAAQSPVNTSAAAELAQQIASQYGTLTFPHGRPTFTSPDGRLTAQIGLQFWYDVGGYIQEANLPPGAPVLNTWNATCGGYAFP